MIERCDKCPYGPGKAVGTRGNPHAPLVIVGEAPGRQELLKGAPFVGPSGKLLHDTAKVAGLDVSNDQTFFTNALRCMPLETPKRATLVCCQCRLLDELMVVPRKLILLMGNSALRSVTGDFQAKITRRRGIVIDTPYGRALPTLHPAAILRNPDGFTHFKRDLEYAAEIMRTEENAVKRMERPNYRVIQPGRLTEVLTRLSKEPRLAADIETTGLNWQRDNILCVGIKAPSFNQVFIFPHESIIHSEFKQFVSEYPGEWIWHNGKFDTLFLNGPGVDHDTMLMSHSLDERPGGHGLKQLSADYLGAPTYDEDVTFDRVTSDLYQYLAWDVACTYGLYQYFLPKIKSDPALEQLYEKLLIPASEFLREVERTGLWVDKVYLNTLERLLANKLEIVQAKIQEAVKPWWDPELYARQTGAKNSVAFNPNSPKQLQWLLYSRSAMGMRAPRGYDNNTKAATLAVMHSNPVTPLILESRGLNKRLSTYVRAVQSLLEQSTDGRLHPSFLLHATETGRLSSRKPNAQNFPRDKDIRDIIQAPPGRKLIEVDYSQAELRVLAWISGDPLLRSIYEQGLDLHTEVAEQFFPGWSELPNDDPRKGELRVLAKSINFGIAYGLGPDKLSRQFDIPYDVAKSYIDTWRIRFATAWEFLGQCRYAARTGKVITTPFGRKRRFAPVKADNIAHIENEASNFPIQSLASDLTLVAAMCLQHQGVDVINIVHDSILIETNDGDTSYLEKEIIKIMEQVPIQTLGIDVPFTAEIKSGHAWGSLNAPEKD